MKQVVILLGSICFLTAGCAVESIQDSVSTAEVNSNIHEWNGKTLTVEGWLGNCGGNDCGLYPSLADARIVGDGIDSTEAWSIAMNRRLSIAYDAEFDRKAYALQFKRVLLTAKVSDECRGENRCFDRGPDLTPISIRADYRKKDN